MPARTPPSQSTDDVLSNSDEPELSTRDQEFVKILRETLAAPSQPGGKTSRRVFVAFQVYHENDRPLISKDPGSPEKQ